MLGMLKERFGRMAVIKQLCELAEQHALDDGQKEPGAEHFLLAALDLPDGTARAAFMAVGADPSGLRQAIEQQYDDALRSIGLNPDPLPKQEGDRPAAHRLYHAVQSGQEVMQALAAQSRKPLSGARVVAVVARMEHGVAARALRAMGIDRKRLLEAAEATG